MKGHWICQRVTDRRKCGHVNPNRRRKCARCGKHRPARKRPDHMSALDVAYDFYVQINGGEHCGICGVEPEHGKRLHRDHEHVGVGRPRGILCFRCNSALRPYMTLSWLRAAVVYLERTEVSS